MSHAATGREPLRRVAIVAKVGPSEGVRLAARLGGWLTDRGVEVSYDGRTSAAMGRSDGFPRDRLPEDCDLAIVTGGDGTLLSVARAAVPRGIPILGVNLGSLGFLTELQPDELGSGLERIVQGEYVVDERLALSVRHLHGERRLSEHALLNDAVITKSALARMITLEMRVDDELVAGYTSDGLIVSTPTGSTAYNLSAGGPILDPRVDAFVVAPICPHSMTHRPLVIPGSVRVAVTLRDTTEEVYLTLDGQVGFPLRGGDTVEVRRYPHPARLVRMPGRSFFDVLRRKLRWGSR